MVKIRLARTGAKKKPFYHIIIADSRSPRDGRFIEKIGYFNPVASGKSIKLLIDDARYVHWIGQGAQPTDRIHTLYKNFVQNDKQPIQNAGTDASA